jgi:hypothetical protein
MGFMVPAFRSCVHPILAAVACASTVLLPAPAGADARSLSLGVKGTYDAGTVFVTDVATGLGAGAALRLTFGGDDARWEFALDADFAGFTGEGDGDPILQLAASLARRDYFGDGNGARTYWFAGAGAGVLGIAGGRAALPLRAGLGISLGGGTGVDLAVFERFTVLFGSGDPAVDFINSVGVEIALRFGR